MTKVFITGGAGFIGAALVKSWLKQDPSAEIVNFDKLTYSGDLTRLESLKKNKRHRFVQADICDVKAVRKAIAGCEIVVHAAAETHVDRSLMNPKVFLETNIYGTQVLLEESRRAGVKRFLQVSTDEVYGSRDKGYFKETDALNPSSPYSVSKTSGDLLALSYHATYGLPVVVTRGSNTFGPYQYPEKVIPLFVSNALAGSPLPLYGDGRQVRNWIYVDDHANGILHAARHGKIGEVYNISSKTELENIIMTRKMLDILGLPQSLIRHVEDRPGHDRRYGMDSSKLRKTGWKEKISFDEAFRGTILWYRENAAWWQKIKSKKSGFKSYYKKAYGRRILVY